MMIYYIVGISFIILIIFIVFLILLNKKIYKLEKKILKKFKEKNNLIPSIYEVTKGYFNKHEEIFREIIILHKKDFSENLFYVNLIEKTKTYKLIHNELNFIFRVCNKHPKINKDYKFLLTKDNIIDKSSQLGENLILYKKIISKYNKLINIKNLTIIGILIPIKKINTI